MMISSISSISTNLQVLHILTNVYTLEGERDARRHDIQTFEECLVSIDSPHAAAVAETTINA
jgi:hypothetical protein